MLITAPLRRRDFRLLWTGMAVSLLGDGIFIVAVAWQAYAISDHPSALAYVTGGTLFGLGVQIAAPVLSATLVIDVLLGLMGKASPQMPLIVLGPAIKSILGVLILIATLKFWPDLYHHLFVDSVTAGEHMLHLAR